MLSFEIVQVYFSGRGFSKESITDAVIVLVNIELFIAEVDNIQMLAEETLQFDLMVIQQLL